MVDGVKCSGQVKQDKEGWRASIRCHQQVVCDPDQCCLGTVSCAETGLEFFKKVVCMEMVMKLSSNHFFHYFRNKWEVRDGSVVYQIIGV